MQVPFILGGPVYTWRTCSRHEDPSGFKPRGPVNMWRTCSQVEVRTQVKVPFTVMEIRMCMYVCMIYAMISRPFFECDVYIV